MNMQWFYVIAFVSTMVGLGWQEKKPLPAQQSKPKAAPDVAKPAARVELKQPGRIYAPAVRNLQELPIPLNNYGQPDMQALEKLRQERLQANDLAVQYTDNMPIFKPDPNVDYKIQIIKPDPRIDYKIQQSIPRGWSNRNATEPGVLEQLDTRIKELSDELTRHGKPAAEPRARKGEKK